MRPIRIFILEDEWMWAEAITSIISKNPDLQIIGEAESGEAGIPKILVHKPDVVLVDLRLKGELGGIQVTEQILEKLPDTKVIIFTIDAQEENLFAAIRAGASGYLLKKEVNNPQTLLGAIRAVHASEAYITPAIAKKMLSILKGYAKGDNQRLSNREKEILLLIEQGKTNNEIAEQLFIHDRTVANHLNNIFNKLDVKNRTEAVIKARREGLLF